jgi:hypothetical protein
MAPGVLAMTVFGTQISNALQDVSTVNPWIVAATVIVFVAITYAVGRWLASVGRHARAH